jgi:hypothetical protein
MIRRKKRNNPLIDKAMKVMAESERIRLLKTLSKARP